MDERSLADPNALFLGPQSENRAVFKELVEFLLDEHIHWRRNFHPKDRPLITLSEQRTTEYEQTIERTRQMLLELSSELKAHSMPWFSPRYLGHMTYDPMMAATLAHFAALLYNPNNVAREGAPATTWMEVAVGEQLADMFGYAATDGGEIPWGHITSGGTVANLEGLWIAKTLQSIPLALHSLSDGSELSADDRYALQSLAPTETLDRLEDALVDSGEETLTSVLDHSVRGQGARPTARAGDSAGVVLVPRSRHYCWDKAVDVLGIGTANLRRIAVDEETYRMDIDDLKRQIQELRENRVPIIAVVAVVGSTEQGAVDPVEEIVSFRQECERRDGWSFYLHLDAAYGGYARTLFIDENDEFVDHHEPSVLRDSFPPEMLQNRDLVYLGDEWPPSEVHRAFAAMRHADSITVDPHKWGYTPYAAGGFVVKDRRVLPLIEHSAPYVRGVEPTASEDATAARETMDTSKYTNPGHLGSFILEGSKSGASVASVWGAHQVTPLNMTGYGRLVGAGIEGAHHFYESLRTEDLTVQVDEQTTETYVVEPLCKPDLNVVNFAFNKQGNRSLKAMNKLNKRLYEECTYNADLPIPTQEFITSKTDLGREKYGDAPRRFLKRFGISQNQWETVGTVLVLRSCVLTPFLAYGTVGPDSTETEPSDPYQSFFDQFTRSMRTHLRTIHPSIKGDEDAERRDP